jgi:redox-sensitive bicupin YhaK (pirin superfamily)
MLPRTKMITLRPADERGHADHGWLDTRFSFSFDQYHDPKHMGFRALRVINEDKVAPGRGFGMHPHRDMEIITYVLDGELAHEDSMGNGSAIRPHEVQRMTAGSGILHSEFNHSPNPVHLLQIWILPERRNLPPSYEQKTFSPEEKLNRLRLVASPDMADGSVLIHQDTKVYSSLLEPGKSVDLTLDAGRHAWIQVARGAIDVNGKRLQAGDGAAVSDELALRITGVNGQSEFLLFDLA